MAAGYPSTVYIVQEPQAGKDLSSASRYGKLRVLLNPSTGGDREKASMAPGPCLFKLRKDLRPFNPEDDYLCFAGGDPLALGLALLALKDNGLKDVNFLRWERERDLSGRRSSSVGFYVPTKLMLQIE